MFNGIFHRHGAGPQGERRERGLSAAPASASEQAVIPADSAAPVDIIVDEGILALDSSLADLARLEVGQAAKERVWAGLQRELEHRPVRAAVPVFSKEAGSKSGDRAGVGRRAATARRTSRSRGWGWALGSAAAVVAVVAGLLGAYGGGLLQTAGNDEHPSTVTSVVASDSTEPDTTVVTDVTTASSEKPVTTGTTQSPDTTGTTGGSPGTSGPTTTRPAQTTTTGEQQWAAAQVERTARQAAFALCDMVIDSFITGNLSGVRSLVAPEAMPSLVQMKSSLNDPYGYNWISSKSLSGNTVRVTVEMSDTVANGAGDLVNQTKRFAITVRVDADAATVIAISAGS